MIARVGLLNSREKALLRGTIVIRTYDTHKQPYLLLNFTNNFWSCLLRPPVGAAFEGTSKPPGRNSVLYSHYRIAARYLGSVVEV